MRVEFWPRFLPGIEWNENMNILSVVIDRTSSRKCFIYKFDAAFLGFQSSGFGNKQNCVTHRICHVWLYITRPHNFNFGVRHSRSSFLATDFVQKEEEDCATIDQGKRTDRARILARKKKRQREEEVDHRGTFCSPREGRGGFRSGLASKHIHLFLHESTMINDYLIKSIKCILLLNLIYCATDLQTSSFNLMFSFN